MRLETNHSENFNPSARIWTRNFILLCLANFVLFMSTQMLFPSLPGYIIKIDGSQRDIGYIMGAYTISAMLMRPFAGWLVDSRGRKLSLTLGMLLMLTAAWLYFIATNTTIMTMVRTLHGIAFGLVNTAISTIVVDSLPAARLSEGVGYFGLTGSLSMCISPIIGFSLVDYAGYNFLFFFTGGATMIAFAASLFVKAANFKSDKKTGMCLSELKEKLFEKSALLPSITIFQVGVVYGSVLSYIALYAASRGIENIGLFFSAMAILMLISRGTCGRWADKGRVNQVLFLGLFSMLIGMITISLADQILKFILAGGLIGIGFGVCMPTLQAQAVRFAPVQKRGAANGTFFAMSDLGLGIGTIIWGYVSAALDYQFMYRLTVIPIIIAGIIYFKFSPAPLKVSSESLTK